MVSALLDLSACKGDRDGTNVVQELKIRSPGSNEKQRRWERKAEVGRRGKKEQSLCSQWATYSKDVASEKAFLKP